MRTITCSVILICIAAVMSSPTNAQVFTFSTGSVTGLMATASRPSSPGKIEIESADDFITSSPFTFINSGTFTGLVPIGATIGQVRVEIYRVFPKDSTNPPSGNVPTRVNSPSDNAFDVRDALAGNLTFTTTTLNPSFTANNSVLNGINKIPNQTTGGEGAVTGQEVLFNVTFNTPFALPADHYFFIPQVMLDGSNNFLWLSSSRPIVAPGTPFAPDLQQWIRNANLDPDWLRVGTDIVGGAPPPTFNGAFSLNGQVTPEPGAIALLASLSLGSAGLLLRKKFHKK